MSKVASVELTGGTETSKYPEEKKSTEILLVAASERRVGQTDQRAGRGCRTRHHVSELTTRRICLPDPPTRLNRDNQYPALLSFSVTPSVKR